MPHYNFQFTNGKHVCSDADGLDLPDDEAARKEAELSACDLWRDPGEGNWKDWTIEVMDEKGRHVVSLPIDRRWNMSRFVSGLAQWLTRVKTHKSQKSLRPSRFRLPGGLEGTGKERVGSTSYVL